MTKLTLLVQVTPPAGMMTTSTPVWRHSTTQSASPTSPNRPDTTQTSSSGGQTTCHQALCTEETGRISYTLTSVICESWLSLADIWELAAPGARTQCHDCCTSWVTSGRSSLPSKIQVENASKLLINSWLWFLWLYCKYVLIHNIWWE